MDYQYSFSEVDGHLSIVGQELESIPIEMGEQYGALTSQLSLNFNQIKYSK